MSEVPLHQTVKCFYLALQSGWDHQSLVFRLRG